MLYTKQKALTRLGSSSVPSLKVPFDVPLSEGALGWLLSLNWNRLEGLRMNQEWTRTGA